MQMQMLTDIIYIIHIYLSPVRPVQDRQIMGPFGTAY